MALDYSDPRASGRQACRESVSPEIWEKNMAFSQKLMANLAKHPIASHPIKEFFETETVSKEKTLLLHLEFGYAFAQIFTDAVLEAMAKATQLEKNRGPLGKASARFLWALNLQDELGYVPSGNQGMYAGTPLAAHYVQYVKLFNELGADINAINHHEPTEESRACRASFEDNYNDYTLLTTALALSESIFDQYAGSWADNVERSTGVNTKEGYHTIHVEDEHGESVDDDHSEDGWTLVRQALVPDRYNEIEKKTNDWLDTWYRFGDKMIELASS